MSDKLDRYYIGVRVGFVLLATFCYFATLFLLSGSSTLDQAQVWDALAWLIGTIAVAVGGDTLRPSGQKRVLFGQPREPTE